MPSSLRTVQVRFIDPKINKMLDALVKAGIASSKSKLLEDLTQDPIRKKFQQWLISRWQSGATYSDLYEATGIPVPELMANIESELALNEADIKSHLTQISQKMGIDVEKLWKEIPPYKLGPA